jgi:hypothetical protein
MFEPKMHKLTLYVSDDEYKALETICLKQSTSKTAVIRYCIQKCLGIRTMGDTIKGGLDKAFSEFRMK